MVDDDHTPDRRTILRNIAAGSAAAVGVGLGSGSASASADPAPGQPSMDNVEAFSRFGDRETIEDLFEADGRSLESELVDRGHLVDVGMPVDEVVSPREYLERDESGLATVEVGSRDGDEVVNVRIRQVTEDAEVEYFLNPGTEEGRAKVYPDQGEEGTVVYADGSEGQFSTSSSCCGCNCWKSCTDEKCWVDCPDDPGYGTVYYDYYQYCCHEVCDEWCYQPNLDYYYCCESHCDCSVDDVGCGCGEETWCS